MKRTLAILLLGCMVAGINAGCKKKRGCTDTYSDNYDPDAEEDDDTCVPTRLKFVGEYDGHGTIETGIDTLVQYDQVVMNVEDSTAFAPDGLLVGISNFDAQLYALSATVTGTHEMMVNRQSLGAFTYWGDGSISGRVLDIKMTRVEEIIVDTITTYDTLYLNLYGIQRLED